MLSLEQRLLDDLAAAWLEDCAQRFGQTIEVTAIGGRQPRAHTVRDQVLQRRAIEERQVAGKDQPAPIGIGVQRRVNAADRPQVRPDVGDGVVSGAVRIIELVRAHRYEAARHQRREQLHRARQLRLAGIFQAGFVALHAPTASAGEYQSVEFRRTHAAILTRERAPTARLPPLFDSSRTLAMRMSCDRALHMS